MTLLEAGAESTQILFRCNLAVEMKAYNQDTPFVFHKVVVGGPTTNKLALFLKSSDFIFLLLDRTRDHPQL